MTPRGLLLLAVWAGLVVGVGELGIWAARRYLFDGIIFFGPDILWMTPVADLILFAAVGLVLAAAVRLRPGPRASAAALGILLLLAMASWVLMFPRASRLSLLLLAMGMSTEAYRRLRNRQERRWRSASPSEDCRPLRRARQTCCSSSWTRCAPPASVSTAVTGRSHPIWTGGRNAGWCSSARL